MQLMRDANFGWVFIGIESSDPQTLKDTRKTQNTQQDVLQSVRTIYGLRHRRARRLHRRFRQRHARELRDPVPVHHGIGHPGRDGRPADRAAADAPLRAARARRTAARRIIDLADNTKLATNVVPKKITYDQLIDAYEKLYRRLLDRPRDRRPHPQQAAAPRPARLRRRVPAAAAHRASCCDCSAGASPRRGPRRIHHFLRSIPWRAPRKLPLAIVDWIAGLAMRDYVQRHFEHARERPRRCSTAGSPRCVRSLPRRFARPRLAGGTSGPDRTVAIARHRRRPALLRPPWPTTRPPAEFPGHHADAQHRFAARAQKRPTSSACSRDWPVTATESSSC